MEWWPGIRWNDRPISVESAAFAATYTFLAINGWPISSNPDATYRFMFGIYERQNFNFEALVAWLRLNTRPAL